MTEKVEDPPPASIRATTRKKAAPKKKATAKKAATKKKAASKKSAAKKTAAKSAPKPKQDPPASRTARDHAGQSMTEALGETFLSDLINDWEVNGSGIIEICRTTKPDAYLKLVATYAPKEFRKTLEPFEGMSDHDLRQRYKEAVEEIRALGLDEGA